MTNPYKRTTYNGRHIDEHRKVMEKYFVLMAIFKEML